MNSGSRILKQVCPCMRRELGGQGDEEVNEGVARYSITLNPQIVVFTRKSYF